MDPNKVIDRGRDDYLIQIALMRKALTLRNEEKIEELEASAKLIAMHLAEVIGKIF